MTISGTTRVFGIMGHPVRHTLSPAMYNGLFSELGIDAVYVAFEVRSEQLSAAVAGARALQLEGFHLTIPHKEAILPLLDAVTEDALRIGAVNVVVNRAGVLCGDNTDGRGLLASLMEETAFVPESAHIAILGAGGTARAIAATFAKAGAAEISLFNRTLERAEQIVEACHGWFPGTRFWVQPWTGAAFAAGGPGYDLVVNAASSAAGPFLETLPIESLKASCVVSDVNYYAEGAPLLSRAAARGLRIHGGLGMLLHQGALSLKMLLGAEIKAAQLGRHLIGR